MTDRITTIASGNIDLPEYCYEALLNAALYYGFMHIKDFDKARFYEQEFDKDVERLKRTFGNVKPNKPIRLSSESGTYNFV